MTLQVPLWLQNHADYNAADSRALIGGLWSAGVVSGLAVGQHSPTAGMSVDVAAGRCVIAGTETAGQGSYLCSSDAVTTVTIAASPGTGESRVDLIVATIRDSAVAGANNDWTITAVTGTTSTGTPAVPSVPPSSIELARVMVGANVSSIVAKDIVDRRSQVGAFAAAGSPSVPPSFDGQVMAAAGVVYVGLAGAWKPVNAAPPPYPRFYSTSSASWTVASGASDQTVMSISVPAPGWPARITAHAQGQTALSLVTAGSIWLDHRVKVGSTAGVAQRVAERTDGTSVGARDLTVPFAPSASASIDGGSATTVALVASASARSWPCTGGQLLVRVDPIDT